MLQARRGRSRVSLWVVAEHLSIRFPARRIAHPGLLLGAHATLDLTRLVGVNVKGTAPKWQSLRYNNKLATPSAPRHTSSSPAFELYRYYHPRPRTCRQRTPWFLSSPALCTRAHYYCCRRGAEAARQPAQASQPSQPAPPLAVLGRRPRCQTLASREGAVSCNIPVTTTRAPYHPTSLRSLLCSSDPCPSLHHEQLVFPKTTLAPERLHQPTNFPPTHRARDSVDPAEA